MTKFFEDNGEYIPGTLPQECIEECSAAGDVSQKIRNWRRKLGFKVNREQATKYLLGFGAWMDDELAEMTDDEIADRVLWIGCGDLKEVGDWFGLIH